MAYYAFLDNDNKVTEVIVGVDENVTQIDTDGTEVGGSSAAWEDFYGKFKNQTCKRTSYNTYGNTHKLDGIPFRGNFAHIGDTYDAAFDIFIPPKPRPSWKFDYENAVWIAPIPKPLPEEGFVWLWSEDNLEWVKVALPPTQ